MLDQFLAVIGPELPPQLVSHANRNQIQSLCKQLPIQGFLGFESRLGKNQERVDISQFFRAADIPDLLARHKNFSSKSTEHTWFDVCTSWNRLSNGTKSWVDKLWFEYDLVEPETTTMPSVFLEGKYQQAAFQQIGWQQTITEFFVNLLSPAEWEPVDRGISNLVEFIPEDFKVDICGVMLSRHQYPVRVLARAPNFKRLITFLCADFETHLSDEFENVFQSLGEFLKSPVITLEYDNKISCSIGLEFHWPKNVDATIPQAILSWLVAKELCTPEKAAALREFPKTLWPHQTSIQWPESLIVESLLTPEQEFSCITGQVNHLKLIFDGQLEPEAKAYFGFIHQTVDPTRRISTN